ncbi:MAG TPA: zinc ribbon domain-containing protein [Candidatus Nanoarchaeia archaeon]
MVADFITFLTNSLTIVIMVAYIFALWAALVVWTWLDISARTDNVFYRFGAILIVATGAILGFAIYLLMRPAFTKEEGRVREVEEAIFASQTQLQACPVCYAAIRKDFAFCPSCSAKLAVECVSCQKKINPAWISCPYCGARQRQIKEREAPVVKGPSLLEKSILLVVGVRTIFSNWNVKNKPKVPTTAHLQTKAHRRKKPAKKKKS